MSAAGLLAPRARSGARACARTLVVAASALLLVCGCEREVRQLRPRPADAAAALRARFDELHAGPADSAISIARAAYATGPVSNQYRENAYAISEGKTLFSAMNCTGCHANGGGGIGPALMDDQWIYGSAPNDVFTTISAGRTNGMPAFGGRIPEYQMWELVAYVRSLGGLVSRNASPGRSDDLQSKPAEQSMPRQHPVRTTTP